MNLKSFTITKDVTKRCDDVSDLYRTIHFKTPVGTARKTYSFLDKSISYILDFEDGTDFTVHYLFNHGNNALLNLSGGIMTNFGCAVELDLLIERLQICKKFLDITETLYHDDDNLWSLKDAWDRKNLAEVGYDGSSFV